MATQNLVAAIPVSVMRLSMASSSRLYGASWPFPTFCLQIMIAKRDVDSSAYWIKHPMTQAAKYRYFHRRHPTTTTSMTPTTTMPQVAKYRHINHRQPTTTPTTTLMTTTISVGYSDIAVVAPQRLPPRRPTSLRMTIQTAPNEMPGGHRRLISPPPPSPSPPPPQPPPPAAPVTSSCRFRLRSAPRRQNRWGVILNFSHENDFLWPLWILQIADWLDLLKGKNCARRERKEGGRKEAKRDDRREWRKLK